MGTNADMSLVKLANYRCVWNYIHSHGEITIPQIAKATGLSIPTVTRAIEYSLDEGAVRSVGIVGGERGRKANLYSLAPDYMHFIFISIHGRNLHFEVHNFLSEIIQRGSFTVSDENILSLLDSVIKKLILQDSLIRFVGIAFSGTVFEGKIIESFIFPSLVGFDLKEYLEKEFSVIAIVENDLHAAVSAFSKYASASENGITVAFYFGDGGYGSGILVDGKLLRGAHGSAGELHDVVTTNKSVRSDLTYAEVLRSLIAVLNPDTVVLYPNGNVNESEIKKVALDGMREYQIPHMIENRNFTKDTFIGLIALCKEKLIEPYAKIQTLKLETE